MKPLAERMYDALVRADNTSDNNVLPVAVLVTALHLQTMRGQHASQHELHTISGFPIYNIVGLQKSVVLMSDGTTRAV